MSTNKLKMFALIILASAFSIFSACSDDDETTSQPAAQTITEIASADSDLSILVQALSSADLVNTLSGDGPYTVFAPTNSAFQELLDSNSSWNSLSDIPADLLKNVLLFHVISGEVKAADLSDTYANSLAVGPNGEALSIQVAVTNGVRFNGDASPIQTDIEATNGVIHTINKVMLPPNAVSLAVNNSEFSTLVAALQDDRHTTDFVSTLSLDGPYTIFAPTNQAFQNLLDSNDDWNGLADIPIATLDAVLKYHVVAGANVQSDQLSNEQSIEMFGSGNTTIDLTNGAKIKTSSGQSVNIAITDVQGSNGVIHAVSEVLLP